MKNLIFIFTALAISASTLISAENALRIDIKTVNNSKKVAFIPVAEALKQCIEKDDRLKVVDFGSDWEIWLLDYQKFDNGETYFVRLKMHLVAPNSDRESPTAISDVSYYFNKEERDVLTTEDKITRFAVAKWNDFQKESKSEKEAAYPVVADAFQSLVPAIKQFYRNRDNITKHRDQDL